MDQLSDGITTLSLVPKSRWQTLLHLDVIRARNKPKEAPKAPEKAPFFLPSMPQNPESGAGKPSVLGLPSSEEPKSRISSSALASRSSAATATSEFTRLLQLASETQRYASLIAYLSLLP